MVRRFFKWVEHRIYSRMGLRRERAEWRVREGLIDSSRAVEALRLLNAVIVLGLPVFQAIDWNADETAALASAIREQAGIDVWL